MAILQFSATKCNKFIDAVKKCAPTMRTIGIKMRITIETEAEPTEEYIRQTEKLLEATPYSAHEYFKNVKCIAIQK